MTYEDVEQAALFEWAALKTSVYPELAWMYATPNGGHRTKKTAKTLKKTGVKPGVSDICLPVKREPFSGMYIELKTPENKALGIKKGRPTKEQLEFGNFVAAQDFFFIVCIGWEAAANSIEGYLNSAGLVTK